MALQLRVALTTTQTEVVASMKAKEETEALRPAFASLKAAVLADRKAE